MSKIEGTKSQGCYYYDKCKLVNKDISLNTDVLLLGRVTSFNWLKWKQNSCRYESFITFYVFSIFDYLNNNNVLLKNIHKLINNI